MSSGPAEHSRPPAGVRAASLRVVRPGDVGEPEPEQAPPTMGSLRQRHGLLRAEIVAGNRKAVERNSAYHFHSIDNSVTHYVGRVYFDRRNR